MAASKTSLPAISPDGNLSRYLEQIRSFPMLEQQQEYMLAKSWKERGDVDAAHQLVTSHLRLVAKIAMGYRGYGLPVADLISEGNLGMMHAVKKFEPEKGFRLATYAMWWIKAAIQEYILRSWSLVKIGTTAGQKKLFFNLRRIKGQIQAIDDGDLKPEQVTQIATQLDVSEAEVISMNQRMAGNDRSLNVPLSRDGEGSGEWQDWLEDDSEDQETTFAEHEEFSARKRLMLEAMQGLNEREQRILQARRLAEPPLTLEDLASEFGVSRERIRQIEVRAFEKLQKAVRGRRAAAGLGVGRLPRRQPFGVGHRPPKMQVPQIEFVDAVRQINGGRHCLLRRLRVRQPVEKRVDRRRAANLRSHWYRWMAGLSSASAPPRGRAMC